MKNTIMWTATTLVVAAGVHAGGGIVMDGFRDDAYQVDEISVQDTQTNFGNSDLGQIDWSNGSELDGARAVIQDDMLYLLLSGNLESNFNKLEVFIDFQDGGQNQLRGDNPDVDFNGLNRMGDDGGGNGLTFDADFAADFYFTMTCGDGGGGVFSSFATYSEVLTDGGGFGEFVGSGGAGANPIVGGQGIMAAIDNSNFLGVDGGDGASSGVGVVTGMEIAIPMSLLGNATGDIKVCAFINGGGHDFLSNQVLGGIGTGPNLGEPRLVDFSVVPGDQYFVVEGAGGMPCPTDIDGSGSTDFNDVVSVLSAWGPCVGCPEDQDGDDEVGFNDLVALLSAWGPCP